MLRSLASDSYSGLSGSANVFNVVAFFVFVFNLLLGNGYLFIPYVFYDAGLFASCLLLLFITFLSCLTAVWTLEVMCRAQALEYYQVRESMQHETLNKFKKKDYESLSNDGEQISSTLRPKPLPIYEISAERKFEIPELCEKFLGKAAKWIYTFVIGVQTFVFLWWSATIAGTTITGIHWLLNGSNKCYDGTFGDSFLTEVPFCKNLYRIYIAAFGVVALPLSFLRLGSQKLLQLLFAILRVIIMVLIFGFYALVDKPVIEEQVANITSSSLHGNESSEENEISPFSTNVTILQLIPIITWAQLIHFAIPCLVHITRARTSLRKAFCSLYVLCWVVFTLHSLLLVTYFQDFLKPNAPHNWAYFTNSSSTSTKTVAYVIQLSPVLNGISIYPMVSVILAEVLFSAFNGADSSTIHSDRKLPTDRGIKILTFSISVLSLVFALEIPNVAEIGQFVNILSLVIVFVFPTLLQYKSKIECKHVLKVNCERETTVESASARQVDLFWSQRIQNSKYRRQNSLEYYPKDTPYSMPYLSSNGFSIIVLLVSILLLICSFLGTYF